MNPNGIISILGFSEPVSSFSHLLMTFFYLVFSIALLRRGQGNTLRTFGLSIYCIFALYLFSMSGVYHLLEHGSLARTIFQRLDHSGIWMMIAGTFTPIHIILFRGFLRFGVLGLVWTIAITGLILEVVFFANFPEWLSLILYLLLGWFGLVTYFYYKKHHKQKAIKFLIYGGVSYSIGAIFEFLNVPTIFDGVFGPHELFHFFVAAGALFHAYFIYLISNICIKEKLTLLVKEREGEEYFVIARGENIAFRSKNLKGIEQKIQKIINQRYSLAHVPEVIRLKFQKESFIRSATFDSSKRNSEIFHQPKRHIDLLD